MEKRAAREAEKEGGKKFHNEIGIFPTRAYVNNLTWKFISSLPASRVNFFRFIAPPSMYAGNKAGSCEWKIDFLRLSER